ncbi:MAG: ABC transporter ATP-binding protein [Candidatus Merdivicinus sp.]|jgi:iron complex transport system ATP-binding protein
MNFAVRGGVFRYGRDKYVLNGVTFDFEGPGILSVLGANGAGKTTLMKCMLGLMPWTEGGSFLNGKNIREYGQKEFWKQVGYVPQAKHSAFVYSIEEMVVLGRSAHLGPFAQPGEKDWKMVDKALEQVGISHLRHKLCSRVSGGEYQLAIIARALVTEPQLLVLDEPESNLDFKNQMIVLEVLRTLCRDGGISAILNTHYPEHAVDISNKSLLMLPDGTGRFGDTAEIITEANLQEAFGIPVNIRTVSLPDREYTCIVPELRR